MTSFQPGPYRMHRHAYVLSLSSDSSVTNWQVNKRTIGSATNALWDNLTSPTIGTPGTWHTSQVRVVRIDVHFDNRSASVTGGSGSVAFSASPRVAACVVPFTEAELGVDVSKIEDFVGRPMSLTARNSVVTIPITPAVSIGNYQDVEGDTRLLIYQSGYNGKVSVVVTYQTMGWPNVGLLV